MATKHTLKEKRHQVQISRYHRYCNHVTDVPYAVTCWAQMYRWRPLKTIFFFQNGDLSFCLLVNGTVFEDGPQNDVFENEGRKRVVSQKEDVIHHPLSQSFDPFGQRRGSIELKLGVIFYANYFYLTVTLFTPFPLSPFFTANVFLLFGVTMTKGTIDENVPVCDRNYRYQSGSYGGELSLLTASTAKRCETTL